jgi:hypothetical protein
MARSHASVLRAALIPNWPMMDVSGILRMIFCPLAFHFTVRGLSAKGPEFP